MQTVQHLPMIGLFAPTFLSFASAKVEHSFETTKHSGHFFVKKFIFPIIHAISSLFRGFLGGFTPIFGDG